VNDEVVLVVHPTENHLDRFRYGNLVKTAATLGGEIMLIDIEAHYVLKDNPKVRPLRNTSSSNGGKKPS
jgi:hypothetical protein